MRWFWIDRFTEFVSEERATAVKNVSLAEEYLLDHFDGFPIMPNSLIIEGMAQTAGLLVSEIRDFAKLVVLGKIARSRFHFPACPGDTLTYRVRIEYVRDGGAVVSATSHVGDRLQAEADIFFAHIDDHDADGQVKQLFDPESLLTWLTVVGVFDIGRKPDGTPLSASDYSTFNPVSA